MFDLSKIIKKFAFVLAVITMSLTFNYVVMAVWQEPTLSPPDGNIEAPVNVSADDQTKDGSLSLNLSGVSPMGLFVNRDAYFMNGNVGIGTIPDPLNKLNIAGKIHSTGDICTDAGGGKCLSTVSAGGGLWTANGADIYNSNTGNVGIGTLNPNTGKLVVSGGNIDITTNKIINAGMPTDPNDVATKAYVDATFGQVAYDNIYFYITTATYQGNLGGLAGANTKCATNRPARVKNGLTYRAYLCDSTTCQKPSAGLYTIVNGVGSGLGQDRYKVINVPGNGNLMLDEIQNGISGIYNPPSEYQYLTTHLGIDSSIFWSSGPQQDTTTGPCAPGAGCYINGWMASVTDMDKSAQTCTNWTSSIGNGHYGDSSRSLSSASGWVGRMSANPYSANCASSYSLLCYAY